MRLTPKTHWALGVLAIASISIGVFLVTWWSRRGTPPEQHPPWNSGVDAADLPFAERKETSIVLRPSGASFKVPPDWVEWYAEFGNNFHLTRRQLDAVARGDGEWDTEYASVCNAALPFDCCGVHAGREGWGAEGASFGDLQLRLYHLNEPADGLTQEIEARATADARRWTGRAPEVESQGGGPWRKTVVSFPLWYGDYGGTAVVDFRTRQVGARTFVFVFMYTDYQDQQKTIDGILASFRPE
jgi:hypothetical protein